ncbi:RNA recognition motif domain-containing protein [Patescibacteria group bacterium]
MKKLYIGNLPYSYNDQELADLLSEYGEVSSAVVIIDRARGRSKGFGFVELDDEGADKALAELNNKEVEGRVLKVSEAKPMNNERRGDFNR